jgi:hypothetical protein
MATPQTYRDGSPDLGARLDHHGPAFSGRRMVSWTVRTAIFLCWALAVLRSNPIAFGGWVLGAVAVVHILIGIEGWRHRRAWIDVHERGLVLCFDGRTRALPWDDVVSYQPSVTRVAGGMLFHNWWSNVARFRITLTTRDGETLVLSSGIDRVLGVGAHARVKTLARLSPRVRKQLDSGERVVLGPFVLDGRGIARGDAHLSWEDFESVSVDGGQIVIRRKSARWAWTKLPYTGMPNPHVLVDVLERRTKRAEKLAA